MNAFLSYALEQPAMLVLPAVGFGLSLLIGRIKTRYVRDGVFFGRSVRPQPSGEIDVSPADAQWDPEGRVDWKITVFAVDGVIACYAASSMAIHASDEWTATAYRIRTDWSAVRSTLLQMPEPASEMLRHAIDRVDRTVAGLGDDATDNTSRALFGFVKALRLLRNALSGSDSPVFELLDARHGVRSRTR